MFFFFCCLAILSLFSLSQILLVFSRIIWLLGVRVIGLLPLTAGSPVRVRPLGAPRGIATLGFLPPSWRVCVQLPSPPSFQSPFSQSPFSRPPAQLEVHLGPAPRRVLGLGSPSPLGTFCRKHYPAAGLGPGGFPGHEELGSSVGHCSASPVAGSPVPLVFWPWVASASLLLPSPARSHRFGLLLE